MYFYCEEIFCDLLYIHSITNISRRKEKLRLIFETYFLTMPGFGT